MGRCRRRRENVAFAKDAVAASGGAPGRYGAWAGLTTALMLFLTACPLPFQYSGRGATAQAGISDPSSPSISAAPEFRYQAADGAEGTIPDGGAVTTGADTELRLSSETPNAVIYYTLDGSDPDPRDDATRRFDTDEPIQLRIENPTVTESTISREVRAIAIGPNMKPSLQSLASLTVQYPQAAQPEFDPPGGTYRSDQTIALSTATSGATIYYRLEKGTSPAPQPEPGQSGTRKYTAPIALTGPAESYRIAAIAVADQRLGSRTARSAYEIDYQADAAPTVTPPTDRYDTPQTLGVSARPDASFYYTRSDSGPPADPTTSDILYDPDNPPQIGYGETGYFKVISVRDGFDPSPVVSREIAVRPEPPRSFALDLGAANSYEFNGTRYSGSRPAFTWTPGAGTLDDSSGEYRLRIGAEEMSVDGSSSSVTWDQNVPAGAQTVFIQALGTNGLWSPEVSTDILVGFVVTRMDDFEAFPDASLSVRQAIDLAENNADKSAILMDVSLSGRIQLGGDTLPPIRNDLTIIGDPSDPGRVTIDGGSGQRLFEIYDGSVEIVGLTLANGRAEGARGSDLNRPNSSGGGGSAGLGGAIFVYGGTGSVFGDDLAPELTIDSVVFSGNVARGGSGGPAGILDANSDPQIGTKGADLPAAAGFAGGFGGAPGTSGQATPGSNGAFGSGGGGGGSAVDPYEPANGGTGGFGGGGGGAGVQLGVTPGSKGGGPGGAFGGDGGNNNDPAASSAGNYLGGGGGGAGLGGAVFAYQADRISIRNSEFNDNAAEGGSGSVGTVAEPNTAGDPGQGVGGAVFLYEVPQSEIGPGNSFTGNSAPDGSPDVYDGPP